MHFGSLVLLVLSLTVAQATAQPKRESVQQESVPRSTPQEHGSAPIDLVDKLRAQLAKQGPEAAAERENAVERLLTLADERAHVVLQQRLANGDDADNVRDLVLKALARHVNNEVDPVFGVREELQELRDRLLRAYGCSLAGFWQGEVDADGLLPPDPLRDLARVCAVRMAPPPLLEGLRQCAKAADKPIEVRVAALRAAGDTQNLLFGGLLAEFLGDDAPPLRLAARQALHLLTFAEETFEKKEQFEAWVARNTGRRYLDLVEEAARLGARRVREQREQQLEERRLAAAAIVRALTERRSGVDWASVQQRTLVEDVGTLRLCLQQLQKTLGDAPLGDDAAGRLAFARALFQRYRNAPTGTDQPRGLLLEVSAYLCRANEGELATELAAELMLQLGGDDQRLQTSALRGLRRYPSPEARAAVVRFAQAAVGKGEGGEPLLAQAMQTLSTAGDSPWRAPADGAADRSAWLELVRTVCTGAFSRDRRNEALAVAVLVDRDGKKVPEVFDMLLELANDTAREADYRTTCLIHMQGFRDTPGRSDQLVSAQLQLLSDPERDVRQFVAIALAKLPDGAEEQKKSWVARTIAALRERLPAETNMDVLQKMLDCLSACSHGPALPGAAIGALNVVLDGVEVPVLPEHSQRVDALLRALSTIAADPLADQGQWIGACEMLLRHERRRMLRVVLESHQAVLLAKEVRNTDATVAQRARAAMRYLLLAALLKPAKESWQSTPELKAEAKDVSAAFDALPPNERLPENLQEPRLRLLRLDVLLACGRPQEVGALGRAMLDEKEPKDYAALSPAQQDQVRLFVAEALLQENKNDAAAQAFCTITPAAASETRAIEFSDRLGRAFAANEPRKAIDWLDRAVRGTAEEDPTFRWRLVALWQARVRANPDEREAVLQEIDRRNAIFEAPDCPEELRKAIGALRGKS